MTQTIKSHSSDVGEVKPSGARMELVCGSTGTSFLDVRSFVLSSSGTSRVVVQEPPSPNTVNAAASRAIDTALEVMMMDDTSSYASSCEEDSDDEEEADDHRNELLKDNLSQLYNELARLRRVGSDDLSSACSSDEESDSDEEEENDLCFLVGRLEEGDPSSPDLFVDSFKSRYGAISPE